MPTKWRCLVSAALVCAATAYCFAWESAMASTSAAPSAPARVCRWFGGKQAAISIRFDDSHPTHIEVAFPLLDEFGLVGHLLRQPGERLVPEVPVGVGGRGHRPRPRTGRPHPQPPRRADRRGGRSADRRAGRADPPSAAQPQADQHDRRRRRALAAAQALRLLHRQVPPLGHGRPVPSAPEHLVLLRGAPHVQRRAASPATWTRRWPRATGSSPTSISSTPPAILPSPRPCSASSWRSSPRHRPSCGRPGMTAIYQYRKEQENAAVWPQPRRTMTLVRLDLTCATDANLFDQPLTLEVDLPAAATAATVMDAAGATVASRVEDAAAGACCASRPRPSTRGSRSTPPAWAPACARRSRR